MPVNNQPPIGMITVKVTAPMISSVTAEVRIISRLAGITRRTAFNPRAKDSGDQYADDIAARIDAMAEEGGNAGVEAAGCLRVVAQHEQRGDNRAVHAGAAERLLRVIADQDTQKVNIPC